jgi:hypothetical protein
VAVLLTLDIEALLLVRSWFDEHTISLRVAEKLMSNIIAKGNEER